MNYKYWKNMNTHDFDNLDPEATIAVLPVGSIEQHGPHLPVGVDTDIVWGVVENSLEKIPDDILCLVLPLMPIGKANEHSDFNGTISLSVNTLISLWTEICENVLRTGIKKILIINGHGGQTNVTSIVARDLRIRHDALVVPINWWSVREKPNEFSEEEYMYGIHGGAEETSVMMHLHPSLVNKDKIDNFISNSYKNRKEFPILCGNGTLHAWKASDLHAGGACGDASIASAEKGKEIINNASDSIIKLLQEMRRFKL